MASASGGFLSPFLDSDLITFCLVHGTGAREKESALEATKENLARTAAPGRGRAATRTRERVFSRTYGCPWRRGGRARRAGVAGQRRERADVEGDEAASGGGGGRVGSVSSSRGDNLQVRETRRVLVRIAVCIRKNRAQENSTKTEPNFFIPLGTQENSAKFHSKLQFLTRKTLSRLVVTRLRTVDARLTWFTAASPMALDRRTAAATLCSALLCVRVAAGGCCCAWSLLLLAISAGPLGKEWGE